MSSAPALPAEHASAPPGPECFNGDQAKRASPAFLHSPPDSNNAHKSDATDSELSDLDEEPLLPDADHSSTPPLPPPQEPEKPEPLRKDELEAGTQDEDIGEVLPDHWSGAVAVFKPTMHQFKDFKRFMDKVNSYGMKSGIIKIIPPPEWKDKQPPLDDLVKGVRVREPIKQDIMGSNGTYRQVNILHGRSYNVPQWRQLCDQSEHQPPARRGERRANAEKPKPPRRPTAPKPADPSTPKKRGRKAAKKKGRQGRKTADEDRPMTPVSPKPEEKEAEETEGDVVNTVEHDTDTDAPAGPRRMGAVQPAKTKTQSVSARRKYSKREGSAMIDESAFRDFDYKMDITDYTPERCEELERAYWKTLTYAPPLYGADMMGTLFDDRTETWNLNKLPNLLDVLGTKIPGVNTAYLYFGMWKATFAWHLEDVDLYSINYVHFGAPKQWYSISQADARRFETAMKSIWPADAKACSQFLRHKGYLISPQHLLQNYGIKVNKVVSYPGEFVVTFPYGYHSGYNLGYNCAEAVNFALEPWLEMGKIAKRCECAQAQDSVWINVYEIERKLRGEETEYEETDEEEEDEEEEGEGDESGLPSPPSSHGVKIKAPSRKRKRDHNEKAPNVKIKKIKLRLKMTRAEPPCALCPNEISSMDLLPTDDDRKVHRVCALYLPETYIDEVDGNEVVSNVSGVHKDRTELKCLYCRSKRGACFQCSHNKCTRAYHATCAAAAGVFIEEGEVPVYGEDQTEYKEQAFQFSCRFHRTKREKKLDGDALEDDSRIKEAARALQKGAVCQFQYHKGDIFAGVVVENQLDEQMLRVDLLPHGERFEVEWKWLLLPDPSDYHLPKASPNAIPLPSSRKAKDKLNAKRSADDKPRKDDPFTEGTTWAEFNLHEVKRNKSQVSVDFSKADQVWHYLPKLSTDARDKYTEDPAKMVHNPKSTFIVPVVKPPKPKPAPKPKLVKYPKPAQVTRPIPPQFPMPGYPTNFTSMGAAPTTWTASRTPKPYVYKPRKPVDPSFVDESRLYTQQRFSVSQPPIAMNSFQPQQHYPQQLPPGYSLPQLETRTVQNGSVQQMNAPQLGSMPQLNQRPSPVSTVPAQQPAQQMPPLQHTQQAPPVQYAQQNQTALKPTTSAKTPARPTPKPSWQIHPQIFQKYPFFQVHHNRDASKYRTPYAPWGGFTNGYEGDLRAHLLANSKELLQRSAITSRPQSQSGYPPAGGAAYSGPRGNSAGSPTPSTPQVPPAGQTVSQGPSPAATTPKPNAENHSAMGPQRAQGSSNVPKLKPAPAPKSYKIPPKQSPVPLPANFLAAMTASPSFISASPKQSSPAFNRPSSRAGEPQKGFGSASPPPASSPSGRPFVAPVSVPKFTGMTPHQAAAKASFAGLPPSTPENALGIISPNSAYVPADAIPPTKHVSFAPCETGSVEVGLAVQQAASRSQVDSAAAPQEFPDVPGSESMEFMERMMANLRRVVQD